MNLIDANYMMKYKGYSAKIEYDDECAIFRGSVIHPNDFITFHGNTIDELKQSFRDSIDVYIEYCEEEKWDLSGFADEPNQQTR